MVSSQLRKYTFLRSLLKFSISSKCSHYLSALTQNWLSNQDSSCHWAFFSFSGHTQFWEMAFNRPLFLHPHENPSSTLTLFSQIFYLSILTDCLESSRCMGTKFTVVTTLHYHSHSILLASIHTWMSPLTSVLQALHPQRATLFSGSSHSITCEFIYLYYYPFIHQI